MVKEFFKKAINLFIAVLEELEGDIQDGDFWD